MFQRVAVRITVLWLLTGLLFASASTLAQEGQRIITSAGMLTRLVFTDNLFLGREGKESDAILQLVPNIAGGRTGNRMSYRFFYGPNALIYGGENSDLNRVFHILQADAAAEVIDDYLAIRATARANQVLIDPESNVGFDALGNPDAFGQTATFSITPVIKLPLIRGDFATVQIEPGIDYVFTSDTEGARVDDGSWGSLSRVRVQSGESFRRSRWTLDYETYAFRADDQSDRQSLFFTLAYPVTGQLSVEGLVGYDTGDFVTVAEGETFRWRITPVWDLSDDSTVAVGFGQRYGGNDWYLRLVKRFARGIVRADYERTISDFRSEIATNDVVQFEDAFGMPITDPLANQDLSGTVGQTALRSGVFLLERFRGTFSYQLGRTNLNWRVWQDRRSYDDANVDRTDSYSYLTLRRPLNPRAAVSGEIYLWNHQEDDPRRADFTQYRLSLQWTYRLNRRTNASVRYSYLERNSDVVRQDYDENRLWLTLNYRLQ